MIQKEMFKNKVILVTGGTGSFGNFITKRLFEMGVKEIRIFSRDEKKQYDMRLHYKNDSRLKFFIGDIRNPQRVEEVMSGVNIVYQAAALKQVPACEHAPFEAIQTNVLGVQNIITAALKYGVEKVVTVSTDKAVKPVNVMGMTKALQERLIINANHSPQNKGTKFCVVRYGNVLQSRGSVVPFFRRQLSEGEQLTITDEGMTRFLLTLGDAIVKKAPTTKIITIADVLSQEIGKKLDYRVIGKYPGEKLHEILITEEELIRTQDMGDFYKVNPYWIDKKFTDITEEYGSGINLIEDQQSIKTLISRSDDEMLGVSIEKGEFSKI